MIVTCAFRQPYLDHNVKQLEAINGLPVLSFRDCLPYKEGLVTENIVDRFQQSLYGFKPHAIYRAMQLGFRKVIWFDPSVYPLESIQTIYEQLDNHPMLVIKGDNHISKMTSPRVLELFDTYDINHIGGTIYAFNFIYEEALNCFFEWQHLETKGYFGDQTEFMDGHWADESVMALCMAKHNIPQVQLNFKYRNQKDA